jgi:hypothetical protein
VALRRPTAFGNGWRPESFTERPSHADQQVGGNAAHDPVHGNWTGKKKVRAAEDATKLEFTYAVTGYLPAGLNTWAVPVDSVLKEQLTRLKNYIEHGNPAPK